MRVLILLLMLVLGRSMAADLSESERHEVEQLRNRFEDACRVKLRDELSARPASPAPLAISRWIADIADPDEYCACTTAAFFEGMTANFLRHGTAEEGRSKAKRAGTGCVLPKLKASFALFCGDMVREVTPVDLRSPRGDEIASEMCRCIQPAVDAISIETFESFASASLRDYVAYQRSHILPSPGMQSLIAQMNACGLTELRPKLEEGR